MKLQRETIVTVPAVLVIAAALPFAVLGTLQTGRVYLFSRELLEELPQRFTGPGRFRFILQPMFAILLGVRGRVVGARAGNPPYLFGLLFAAGRRREQLRSGAAAISTLLAMGVILDVVFQLVLYRAVHPGAASLVGPILICIPYALSRALTTRLARGLGVEEGSNKHGSMVQISCHFRNQHLGVAARTRSEIPETGESRHSAKAGVGCHRLPWL